MTHWARGARDERRASPSLASLPDERSQRQQIIVGLPVGTTAPVGSPPSQPFNAAAPGVPDRAAVPLSNTLRTTAHAPLTLTFVPLQPLWSHTSTEPPEHVTSHAHAVQAR